MGHQLANGRLEVEIAKVGRYQGTRFDRTGFITQVKLSESGHTFCVHEFAEGFNPQAGSGLCNEFGLHEGMGYAEAEVGDWFPKLGVGLLKRVSEAPYNFQHAYPAEPFDVDVISGDSNISYTVRSRSINGYAARLVKKISIEDTVLTIDYELINEGSRSIDTEEYVHNFIGINEEAVGPEYKLKLPVPVRFTEVESDYTSDLLSVQDNEIGWTARPHKPFYGRMKGFNGGDYPYSWELTHSACRAGVREISDFPVAHMALWGTGHVISPEVFVRLSLAPGEKRSWSRKYQFFCW
ncbi:hypothetical protein ACWGNU_17730 [Paenibacillus lautus]|uniref:hypothetical protein n=1 Tax=Paenibacillus lautus TaxID=1401 RepID=UPI001B26DAC4|nr:hypothetical protein [Paenibacillus lautus]GIP05048.1 hypothetical protein J28TS4_34550 [Paenibacillus lautus]